MYRDCMNGLYPNSPQMGWNISIKVCCIIITFLVPNGLCYSTSSAGSLYTALTFGYNNLIRPSGTTDVTVSMGILSVNQLDVKSQTFSTTGWLDVSWTDSRFSWTPSSFSNINEMFLDNTYCWDPKVIVDNNINDATVLAESSLLFKIDYTGVVTWSTSGEFTVHCSMDAAFYPYDVQTCFLSVKSWSFPASAVALTAADIYTNQYRENDEWEMTSTSMTSLNVSTNGVAYSNILFNFKMTRRSGTVMMTLVLPLVIISFVNVLVFMVPVESSGKLGFLLASLIADVILLNTLMDFIPVSASIPALGTYVLLLVIVNFCEIFLTVLVMKLFHNKDRNKPVTDTYVRLTAVLSAVTCYRHTDNHPGNQADSPTNETISTSIESPQENASPPEFKHPLKRRLSIKTISPDCSFSNSNKEDFRRAARRSKAWTNDGNLCGSGVDRKYTWEQVSSAVDRFCFVIFLLLRLILAIVFMALISTGSS